MRVLVLGAGVIGISTAYELLQDGHQVTVLDRSPAAAAETSFANAGLLSPGHALPWASPKVPLILLRSLYRNDQAFRMGFSLDPAFWRWCWQFLLQCRNSAVHLNGQRSYRLASYSLQCLQQIAEHTHINFHHQTRGLLYLHHSPASLREGVAHSKLLQEFGHEAQVLSPAEITALDPAFATQEQSLSGAIYCPKDQSGDCQSFSRALAEYCIQNGVEFHYDTTVTRLETQGQQVTQVHTQQGSHSADAIVLALGSYSPLVAQTLGLRVPVYPVKGYSLTFPIGPEHQAPLIAGVDEDKLCAFSKLGDRLRITATAEFAGYNANHKPSDFEHMIAFAQQCFPNAADYTAPSYWACLRAMTPWGPPLFGTARYQNLYLNTGQGHLGWTMAAGSARITADLISGKTTEIPVQGMLYKGK